MSEMDASDGALGALMVAFVVLIGLAGAYLTGKDHGCALAVQLLRVTDNPASTVIAKECK